MATVAAPAQEERIVLHNVVWETYERLLADHVDSCVPHFTYDQGKQEISSPSAEHETDNRTLALLVEMVAMELAIEVCNVGSMTFKRGDLLQGFEPDSSFSIQHEPHVRGRVEIDLARDPPPDLVIEIEVTRPVIPKLPSMRRWACRKSGAVRASASRSCSSRKERTARQQSAPHLLLSRATSSHGS